jgi:hypothetical protein
MFYFAKFIQAIGFADVGYALFVGVTREHAMAAELRLLLIGVGIFYVGRLLERRVTT